MMGSSPIGLIAGNGHFPLLIAKAVQQEGEKNGGRGPLGRNPGGTAVPGGKNMLDPTGEFGKLVRFFKKQGVKEVSDGRWDR